MSYVYLYRHMTASETDAQRRSRVLTALGAYQKAGALSDDIGDMADMLTDESDRGVVVILGSLLEDILLERLIASFMPLTNRQEKDLVNGGGALNAFANRIRLARALGIIDDDLVAMLDVIRTMRNACAHSRQHIDFLTPELKDVLELLFDGETVADIRGDRSGLALRWMFILGYSHVADRLRGLPEEQANERAQRRMNAMAAYVREAAEKHQASLQKRRDRRASRSDGGA